MVKKTDFKKLVLGNAGKKRVKSGNWSLFGIGKKKHDAKDLHRKDKKGTHVIWSHVDYSSDKKKAQSMARELSKHRPSRVVKHKGGYYVQGKFRADKKYKYLGIGD